MAKEPQSKENEAADGKVGGPAMPTVNWDDSGMTTSYANVVNAASTREEVTLFFGTNRTWNPVGKSEFDVNLSDRIVLNPYAAKRLWTLLGAVLQEYERRFGQLNMDLGALAGRVGAAQVSGGAPVPESKAATAPEKKADDSADG